MESPASTPAAGLPRRAANSRKTLLSAPTDPSLLPALEEAITARFLEEAERLRTKLGLTSGTVTASIGAYRDFLRQLSQREVKLRLSHIRRLADVFNADYHYILFGVENPDPDKRGYKQPKERKPDGKKEQARLAEIDAWINYRFLKEVERVEREGRVVNRLWLSEQLHVSRDIFQAIRRGSKGKKRSSILPGHLVLFKQKLNADYHFVLWGFDRPEISLPVLVVNGQQVRIWHEEWRYQFDYASTAPAEWPACIKDRDPEDEVKRFPTAYYLDLPTVPGK